jgi:hypothetical protein
MINKNLTNKSTTNDSELEGMIITHSLCQFLNLHDKINKIYYFFGNA